MTTSNKKAPPFLIKTYRMLSIPEYQNIIHWNESENGFVISDTNAFTLTILPTYFKHQNMQSYIRQLNMYGFSKKRGPSCNYYHHPSFLKGRPQLICQIKRKVQNKGSKRMHSSVTSIDIHGTNEEQPHQILLKMNYYLLLQQITNLKLILQDLQTSNNDREKFEDTMHIYMNLHYKLLKLCKGKEEKVPTASTLIQKNQIEQ